MNRIVFFNHYHRGDLHTHKEFVRQITKELPNVKFEYLHGNPPKLIQELNIPTVGTPQQLDRKKALFKDSDTLYVNTWVGCMWDVFCKHGGINMNTLYEQWGKIYNAINKFFGSNLQLKSKEEYLPRIDYTNVFKDGVDEYVSTSSGKYKVLICNNTPSSNQSMMTDMEEFIVPLAEANPRVDFILTDDIFSDLENIKYTKHICRVEDGIDLLEISYLSRFVDVIVGKNSGPFVFCETYDNYMDHGKKFISFNTKHPDYDVIMETMSRDLTLNCSYKAVPIYDIISLTKEDKIRVKEALEGCLK